MFRDVKFTADKSDDYYDGPGWSFSQAHILPTQPELFQARFITKQWPFEPTPAMQFGSMVHARILEPDTFATRYPMARPCCGVLASGKRKGEQCGLSASLCTASGYWYCGTHGKDKPVEEVECITSEDAKKLSAIACNLQTDQQIHELLTCPGEVEYSLSGYHITTGLQVRSRLDKVCDTRGVRLILDLKTCSIDPTDERLVGNTIIQRCYFAQAAFYLDMMAALGKPCVGFAFVFIRTSPPFNACLWLLQEQDILIGRRHNEIALCDLQRRLTRNDWHGPRFNEPNTMHLADWFYRTADEPIDYSKDFEPATEIE